MIGFLSGGCGMFSWHAISTSLLLVVIRGLQELVSEKHWRPLEYPLNSTKGACRRSSCSNTNEYMLRRSWGQREVQILVTCWMGILRCGWSRLDVIHTVWTLGSARGVQQSARRDKNSDGHRKAWGYTENLQVHYRRGRVADRSWVAPWRIGLGYGRSSTYTTLCTFPSSTLIKRRGDDRKNQVPDTANMNFLRAVASVARLDRYRNMALSWERQQAATSPNREIHAQMVRTGTVATLNTAGMA